MIGYIEIDTIGFKMPQASMKGKIVNHSYGGLLANVISLKIYLTLSRLTKSIEGQETANPTHFIHLDSQLAYAHFYIFQ